MDGKANNGQALVLAAGSGAVTLTGAVGTTSAALKSITVTTNSTLAAHAVTSYDTQSYTASQATLYGNLKTTDASAAGVSFAGSTAVVLGASAQIDTSASSGGVSFGGAVDAALAGSQGLDLKLGGSGSATASADIGAGAALGTLMLTSGTLAMAGHALHLADNVSRTSGLVSSSGTIYLEGGAAQSVTFSGSTSLNNLELNKTAGTATLNGSGSEVWGGNLKLDTTNAGILDLGASTSVTGNVDIEAGTLSTGNHALTVNGLTSIAASSDLDASGMSSATLKLVGNVSGSGTLDAAPTTTEIDGAMTVSYFNHHGGTVAFKNTSADQSVNGYTFSSVQIADTGHTVTMAGNWIIAGSLTTTAGNLTDGGNSLSFTGTSGSVSLAVSTVTSTGTWTFAGTTSLTTNGNVLENIVLGNGTGSPATQTLTLADSLAQTGTFSVAPSSGNPTLNMGGHGWTFGGATLDLSNLYALSNVGTLTFNGASTLTPPNASAGYLASIVLGDSAASGNESLAIGASMQQSGSFSVVKAGTATRSLSVGALAQWTVGGNVNFTNLGFFTPSTSTLALDGTASQLTSAGLSLNNLTVGDSSSASGEQLTIEDNTAVLGNLAAVKNGTRTLAIASGKTLTVTGNLDFSNLGSFSMTGATVAFNNGSSQTVKPNGMNFDSVTIGGANVKWTGTRRWGTWRSKAGRP